MSIVKAVSADLPLNQGDLLSGVKLVLTGNMDALNGGESVVSRTDHCLVISRPCVTAHKGSVVVAAVQLINEKTPSEITTFDKALRFLETQLRDGSDSPDMFYLGQLPGKESEGRWAARFDSIHTIQVPQRPELRSQFIAKHRIARLETEFAHDLHLRHFRAFASLGFDDLGWFTDADLKYLVGVGIAEISSMKSDIDRLKAATEADGGKGNEVKSTQNRLDTIAEKLKPFQEELAKRKRANSPVVSSTIEIEQITGESL